MALDQIAKDDGRDRRDNAKCGLWTIEAANGADIVAELDRNRY